LSEVSAGLGHDQTIDAQLIEATPDVENEQMHLIAKMAAGELGRAYPGHLWMIGWAPGMTLVIKHMLGDAKYGYTVDAAKAATVSQLEHAIIMGGGELLERLGLPRRAWNGDMPEHTYDGVRTQDKIQLM